MHIPSHILQQAIQIYLAAAYPPPAKIPDAIAARAAPLLALTIGEVPLHLLETDPATPSYILRLGQPLYPHMKLVADSTPVNPAAPTESPPPPDFMLRVDSHDRHLHAAPGSPDAAWLTHIRQSNKELGERIEAEWSAAGLPTFKDYLRRQLDARKRPSPRP